MAVSRSRRSLAGIIFIIAGALFLLTALLPYVGVSFPWLLLLAALAMTVAFAVFAVGAVNSTFSKVLLIIAAVGWAILALSTLVALPGALVVLGAIAAGVAGLIAAILLYAGKEVTNVSAVLFIVATALGLLYLLAAVGTLGLGSLATIVVVLFGVALIASGYYFTRKERGRR